MTPDAYCERKAAESGSSFYYSFRLLPPPRRRAITALYAFCREVDDVVDEVGDRGVARAKLEWWRFEVARVFGGDAQHPVGPALAPVVREFPLPQASLQAVIDGMAMDLDHRGFDDFAALHDYCHHVAGVVGTMSASIFGYDDPSTPGYAHDLGIAFQLTNIIRDVGEDARRGRIYLPRDELARFGVSEAALRARRAEPRLRRADGLRRARARDCRARAVATVRRRPPAPAARAGDGGHLPHAARRDRARRLPRARPPHRADAAAQAVDRVARRATCCKAAATLWGTAGAARFGGRPRGRASQ